MKLMEWRSLYEEFQSKQGLWELIKYEIRKFTINYSPKNKKKERGSKKVLLNTSENLESSFAINPTEEIFTEIQSVKKQLEKIDNDKLNGAIVRSRIKWVEQGEKSSKSFFSMEKNNFVKKHIRKLQTKTGEIITNPKEITQHQRKYYSELLGPKNIKINNENLKYFLNQKNIPKLSRQQKLSCEGKVTIEECTNVLKSFKENKSPGNDGLTIEFYKFSGIALKKLWSTASMKVLKKVN